jgi:hypothetical protein
MEEVKTCPRCHGGIWVTDLAEWSVDADPDRLRRQGWVGSGGSDAGVAIHLGCLTWAEKDALLGGAAAVPVPRAHTLPRVRRSTRFVRRASSVAESLPAA